MSLNDPISDMLTVIRNASRAKHDTATVKRSNFTLAILNVLKNERFIFNFKSIEDERQGMIRVYLKTPESSTDKKALRRINRIQKISKPGCRRYANHTEIPRVLNGLGCSVISTSKGVMSGQKARRNRIGGEVLLTIW